MINIFKKKSHDIGSCEESVEDRAPRLADHVTSSRVDNTERRSPSFDAVEEIHSVAGTSIKSRSSVNAPAINAAAADVWQLLGHGNTEDLKQHGSLEDQVPQFHAPRGPTAGPYACDDATLSQTFTPTCPRLTTLGFAGRHKEVQRIITAIEEEYAHIVIFGSRGVGKTSLTNVVAQRAAEADYQVVRYPCSSDVTFEEMFRHLLRDLPGAYMDRTVNQTVEHFEQLLPQGSFGPTELAKALDFLSARHVVIIIDEFDRIVSTQLKIRLAEAIKSLSDLVACVTFIMVGVAETLEELIGAHPSIPRQLVGVHLPLMDQSEVQTLIQMGAQVSRLHFESMTLDLIVTLAKGLPYNAQLLCLHAGRHAMERGSNVVEKSDLHAGIEKILEEMDTSTAKSYATATQDEHKAFITELLVSAAFCEFDRYGRFTAKDVKNIHANLFDRDVNELHIRRRLSRLSADRTCSVLRKIHTPAGDPRYLFVSPLMPHYIMLRQTRRWPIV